MATLDDFLAEMLAKLPEDPEKWNQLSHAKLGAEREKAKGVDPALYQQLAPAEHRAFAREFTQDTYGLGAIPTAAAAPLYYLSKQPIVRAIPEQFGWVEKDATPPSLDQLGASYKGILEGLMNLTKYNRKD